MLQLILGPAGSGKTTLLREQVVQAVGQGKQVLYLVPEQFSFEGEAQLHALLTGEESCLLYTSCSKRAWPTRVRCP